jgi:hypothetical protein
VHAFLDRPLTGEWRYLWLDATYLKQREGGRIVSVAAIIAVAANTDGRREIVGLHIGPSEAETFWSSFLKRLAWLTCQPSPASRPVSWAKASPRPDARAGTGEAAVAVGAGEAIGAKSAASEPAVAIVVAVRMRPLSRLATDKAASKRALLISISLSACRR